MPPPSPKPEPEAFPGANDDLVTAVYEELRRLAACRLAGEAPGQTLQATALVHEAWLRLGSGKDHAWKDRNHFLAVAALAMRHVLIDQARRKAATRHGGAWRRVELSDALDFPAPQDSQNPDERLERLDGAIERLSTLHPERAQLVRLRFYAGLTIEEAAGVLGVSPATAKRHWTFARAWLFREVTRGARTR